MTDDLTNLARSIIEAESNLRHWRQITGATEDARKAKRLELLDRAKVGPKGYVALTRELVEGATR